MKAQTTCPTCRGIAVKANNKLFPFCSERCHLVDLGRWLDEVYRIPDEPDTSGGGIDTTAPPASDRDDR